jgi:hypothetical protein
MWSASGSDWTRAALVFSATAALATWPVGDRPKTATAAHTSAPAAPVAIKPTAPAIAQPTSPIVAPAAPKPTNVLAVRVTANGAAKPSAEVNLSDGSRPTLATAITDHEGIARFEQLAPGAYEVWAREGTLVSNLARIDELATKPEVALELAPGVAVRGQVTVDGIAEAPKSASITLVPVDVDHVIRVAAADANGKFSLAGVPAGKWRIEGALSGHVQAQDQVVELKTKPLEAPADPELTVTMLRAGAVGGVVVDGNGTPVANATIVLRKQGAQVMTTERFVSKQLRWVHPLAGRRLLPWGEFVRFGAPRAGARNAECGQGHCGVDIGSIRGTAIHAAADGEVTIAHVESRGEAGRAIAIDHGHGLKTYYMHLDTLRAGIEPGLRVRAGDALGTMGDTGAARGPHLHFALSQEREGRTWFLDPEPVLQHAVVLAQPRTLDPIDAADAKLIASIRQPHAPTAEPTRTFTTDSQGRYRVDGVGPGAYVAVAFAAALAPGSSESFTIRSGSDTSDVRITMHPGVLVQGRVVGRDGPLPGVSVIANAGTGESAAKVATTTTSAQGDFTLRALSGNITLAVSAPGYGVVERTLALGDYGPRRREDFTLLVENAQLRGQVLMADGGAAANVNVRIVDGPTRKQTTTDRAGRFTIDRAAAGNYVLEIAGGDFPATRAAAQSDRWTEIRLERGGGLRVDLRDARSYAALKDLAIEATGPGGASATATSDATGIAALRGLVPGTWTVRVRAKGFTQLTQTIQVRTATDDVRLMLSRSATLAGVVRDRRGARVANVRVFTDGISTTTDALGNFRLPDAPAGTYWLEAELDGVRGATKVSVDAGSERQTIEIELPQ